MTLIDVRHARDAQAAAAAAAAVQLRWMLVIVMHDHELTAGCYPPSTYCLYHTVLDHILPFLGARSDHAHPVPIRNKRVRPQERLAVSPRTFHPM